jgi:hypothetical protein
MFRQVLAFLASLIPSATLSRDDLECTGPVSRAGRRRLERLAVEVLDQITAGFMPSAVDTESLAKLARRAARVGFEKTSRQVE